MRALPPVGTILTFKGVFTQNLSLIHIYRANHIIQKVPAIDMDPKRRDEIVNEAKLLHALYRLYQAWLCLLNTSSS